MRSLIRILALYRPYWPWVALSFVISLATLLANVALLAVSGWFITAMAVAGVAGLSMNYFTPAAIIRLCAIVRTGGRYLERVVSHEATFRMLARLRVWLYERVEPQPPAALEPYHSGDLASRLRSDIDRLETVYLRVVNPVAVAVFAVGILLAVLTRYSPTVALVVATCLGVAGFMVPLAIGRASAPWSRHRVRVATSLTEASVDIVQGMGEVLAYAPGGQRHRDRFLALGRDLVGAQERLSRLAGLSQAATLLASNAALLGVVVVTIPLVRAGHLQGADFVMLAMLALAGFEAVAPLPAAFQSLGGVLEAASRLFALADGEPNMAQPAGLWTTVPDRCDLTLSRVTFRYSADAAPVVADFDLTLPQGGRLAILGPTGSGKSTLVALLTGLARPEAGAMTLGGRSFDTYDLETLWRCFAVAPQSPSLFTGTIADNLRLARPDAEDSALWHVLAVAQLDEFVRTLPNGLDTYVGEAGLTLSGGQARRLSVARALLKDASILILDEPGEGLDYQTERALLSSVVAALGERSLILITHRIAGLELVDRTVPLGGVTRN